MRADGGFDKVKFGAMLLEVLGLGALPVTIEVLSYSDKKYVMIQIGEYSKNQTAFEDKLKSNNLCYRSARSNQYMYGIEFNQEEFNQLGAKISSEASRIDYFAALEKSSSTSQKRTAIWGSKKEENAPLLSDSDAESSSCWSCCR